jgi:glucosamine-6-phosphate deaminase
MSTACEPKVRIITMIDKPFSEEEICIHVRDNRAEMGRKAAHDIATELQERLKEQAGARIIFAAAPSQSEMLAALVREPDIDWSRVTAFHMDEYLGLDRNAPQRFSHWLRRTLFDHLPFGTVHLIEPDENPDRVAKEYAEALAAEAIDIVCLGVGVNAHLAFNDPPADFNDPKAVRVVTLDHVCRQQQVEDGCFATLQDVPRCALTLTVPRLLAANRLFCCAPGSAKREAIRRTIHEPISPECPSTALRLHPNCTLYLDRDSAANAL